MHLSKHSFSVFFLFITLISCEGCVVSASKFPSASNAAADPVALGISPAALVLVTSQSTQLLAHINYGDKSSSDGTSKVLWSSSASSILGVTAEGMIDCKKEGNSLITAQLNSLIATSDVRCVSSQIQRLHFANEPTVIRSNSSFRYQVFAESNDGNTIDVTEATSWSMDSTIGNISSSGLVSCNNPGQTDVSATLSTLKIHTSITCVLASITPTPGFVESEKTFDGPFPSWINIKDAYGAQGDGITDDTQAFERALVALAQHGAVLWIPRGTYVISRPLALKGTAGVTILGEDPQTTTLSWHGPTGGTMLTLDGCAGLNLGRLTWDGRNATSVEIELTWTSQAAYYPTYNLLHDSKLTNSAVGLHLGFAGETTIDRLHFDHLSTGISLGNYNSLNFNVIDSLFTDNGYGVTNIYGAGAFNVSNSVFERSSASDLAIGNTGPFSVRNNLSVDSKMFFTTGMAGNPANIVIQGNTIVHPGSDPITIGVPASLMLLDNRFLHLESSLHILTSFCYSPLAFISAGNTYAVSQPFAGNLAHYSSIDEAVSSTDSDLLVQIPTKVYTPPFSHRVVFNLDKDSTADTIQTAINEAVSIGGGVVHFSAGNYFIEHTLTIPQGGKVALLGDGLITALCATDRMQGPILRSAGVRTQIEDIRFSSCSSSTNNAAIELSMPDDPTTRVFCDECATVNIQNSAFEVDGLDHATVEIKVAALNSQGPSVRIHGGPARQAHIRTVGNVAGYMVSADRYEVDLGGHFLLEDGWHDTGQGDQQFDLTGDGSVTQQGGTIYTSAGGAMTLHDYRGSLNLLGVSTNSYVQIARSTGSLVGIVGTLQVTGKSAVQNSDLSASVLELTNASTPDNYLPTQMADSVVTPMQVEQTLAMTRTQHLSRRAPQLYAGTLVRMARVFLDGNSVGIKLLRGGPQQTSGAYLIASLNRSDTGAKGVCGAGHTSVIGRWTFQDRSDGYVGLSRDGMFLSENVTSDEYGNGVDLSPTTSSALDRWDFQQIGDGSVAIVNRATGNLLTRAADGCAYSTAWKGDTSQHWLLTGGM